MKIDMLTPEEKQMLLEALQGGDNQAEEDSKFDALCKAVDLLQGLYDKLDEKVDMVVSLLQDEIVEPIKQEYEAGRRANGIKELSGKYGDKFGPYGDFYKGLTGADIFEKLWDEIEERKSGADQWTEEGESGLIEELLNGLKAKKEGVEGALKPKEEVKEEPEGGAVTIEKVSAEPVDGKKDIEDFVKKLKGRGGIPGMGK